MHIISAQYPAGQTSMKTQYAVVGARPKIEEAHQVRVPNEADGAEVDIDECSPDGSQILYPAKAKMQMWTRNQSAQELVRIAPLAEAGTPSARPERTASEHVDDLAGVIRLAKERYGTTTGLPRCPQMIVLLTETSLFVAR